MTKAIDITPTPRILRTLGDIPFDIWQCLAELSDNSLDSFRERSRRGSPVANARVDIHWSNEATPAFDREIIVEDNGSGMSIEQLQNAARAGFSNNDPIYNLGLFGMGFNISTARLGDETIFLSATKESSSWVALRINFGELIKNQSFTAPVEFIPKDSPNECGTRVIVRQLKNGVYNDIRRKSTSIRKRLEIIYAPLIGKENVEIYLQGKKLRPRPHCIWGESRYVVRRGQSVYAVQKIDRNLGETWFDIVKNRYLSEDEADEYNIRNSKNEPIPEELVRRSRHLVGWVGIQRYSDTSEFGIDFVRNGRKILIGDKSLFGFENPDTGSVVSEYPIELGSTLGGRIVGELHVDYLIPTYQKNGFDTNDIAWRLTMDEIRGAGPILPKRRKFLDYDGDNISPLGLLVNAYRRLDPGTKNLSLPANEAKQFRRKFEEGDPAYAHDDKWYKAAQEIDRERGSPTTAVDPGHTPTDNPGEYAPTSDEEEGTPPTSLQTHPIDPVTPSGTTTKDELIEHSERVERQCASYSYSQSPPLSVTARRTIGKQIKVLGTRMPYMVFNDGTDVDFFYDETHQLLAEYPITPRQLLLHAISEIFALRDNVVTASKVFVDLVENHLADERINSEALKERAQAILNDIRDRLPDLLKTRVQDAKNIVKEVESEEESLANNLLDKRPNLLNEYDQVSAKAHEALAYIPSETLIRLVEKMPEEFLDDNVFTLPYQKINVGTKDAKGRLRKASVEKIVSYLRDINSLLRGDGNTARYEKYELIRYSNTLSILEGRLV